MLKLMKKYSILISVVLIVVASYYAELKSLFVLLTLLSVSYGICWAIQLPLKADYTTRATTGNIWSLGVGVFAAFYIASLILAPAAITSFLVIGIPLAGFAGMIHRAWPILLRNT